MRLRKAQDAPSAGKTPKSLAREGDVEQGVYRGGVSLCLDSLQVIRVALFALLLVGFGLFIGGVATRSTGVASGAVVGIGVPGVGWLLLRR